MRDYQVIILLIIALLGVLQIYRIYAKNRKQKIMRKRK